jgi:hypothetical protein
VFSRIGAVHDVGTVTFFLYFENEADAEQGRAALLEGGFSPHPCDPPEEGDPNWSVLAERDMHDAEVEGHLDRVRAIAARTGGQLDGIATPWPGHPAHSPPGRRPLGPD